LCRAVPDGSLGSLLLKNALLLALGTHDSIISVQGIMRMVGFQAAPAQLFGDSSFDKHVPTIISFAASTATWTLRHPHAVKAVASAPMCKVPRNLHEDARDVARALLAL
jgi:hypothetical protein